MLESAVLFLLNLFYAFANFCLDLLPNSSPMGSKSAPATADVAYANYRLFDELNRKVRESLRKAIEADETRIVKSRVIGLYENVLKQINKALEIRHTSCPSHKQTEVQEQQKKLRAFVGQTKDRLEKLASIEPMAIRATHLPLATVETGNNRVRRMPCTSTDQRLVSNRQNLSKMSLLKSVDSKLGDEILATIVETTDIRLDDIEGNAMAKLALEESVVLPALNPKLFTGLRAPCTGILLFGPPGNGKTMLAKAVASECNSTFFSISAATIMSKWVGDGERLVKALFQVARNAQPSIIFIDEVDSMLCQRFEQENGAARRVKTEFLVQLDGCSSEKEANGHVLVLAATNRPQELDEGILRRFPQRIFIDLPDKKARFQMIRRTFKQSNTKLQLNDAELERIAAMTDNYSYSDLKALCRAAALFPVQSARMENRDLRRCTAEQLRPVNVADLENAIRSVRPSINAESRKKLIGFAENHANLAT
ncbi:hypothetical protein niasHS_011074 [Heterodera schachtii]|uniref:microtubule-severing ATPase n=1 Tax=Heterodera schachtii TaxID=97005 RepID=A0ABD2ITF3_HETSC